MSPDGPGGAPAGAGPRAVADQRLAGFGRPGDGGFRGTLAPARTSLLRENVRMALEALLSTKMRSMLTLLGLMIGVGAVIAMMAVVAGLNGTVKKQIASLGSGVLYVSKYDAGVHFGDDRPRKPRKDLTVADADAIAEFCPSAAGVSPEIQDMGYLQAGGVKSSVITARRRDRRLRRGQRLGAGGGAPLHRRRGEAPLAGVRSGRRSGGRAVSRTAVPSGNGSTTTGTGFSWSGC